MPSWRQDWYGRLEEQMERLLMQRKGEENQTLIKTLITFCASFGIFHIWKGARLSLLLHENEWLSSSHQTTLATNDANQLLLTECATIIIIVIIICPGDCFSKCLRSCLRIIAITIRRPADHIDWTWLNFANSKPLLEISWLANIILHCVIDINCHQMSVHFAQFVGHSK